jgi:hypothetical protein
MNSRSKVDLAKCGRIPVSDRKKPDCLSHFEKISLSLARLAAQAKILHLELSLLPENKIQICQFYSCIKISSCLAKKSLFAFIKSLWIILR